MTEVEVRYKIFLAIIGSVLLHNIPGQPSYCGYCKLGMGEEGLDMASALTSAVRTSIHSRAVND